MRHILPIAAAIAAAACNSPPATQPEDFNTVDATATDPGALGNEAADYGEGSTTPAEANNMGNAIRSQDHPSAGDNSSSGPSR